MQFQVRPFWRAISLSIHGASSLHTTQTDSRHSAPSSSASPDRAEQTSSLFRSALTIAGVYLLIMAIILAGAWALITQDWVRQQRIQETELASLARAQNEHVAHTFSKAGEALRNLATLIAQEKTDPALLAKRLQEQAAEDMLRTPQLRLFAAYNAAGTELFSLRQRGNASLPALPQASLAYWRQNTDSRIFIHPPVRDASGNWFIPIEQGARNAQGDVLGSAFALLATQDFNEFFRETQLTPQDRFSLLSLNGVLLLHFPAQSDEAPPDFASLLAQASRDRNTVTFETTYQFGDSRHIGVFRLLRDLPLIAVVSRPTDVARAGFLAMKQRLVMGVAALAILLALVSWLIHSDAKRHEQARTALGRLNSNLEARVGRRTAELEQSNRELIAFSYSISHDLRAPLRAINGFAHALREDFGAQLDAQGRDYLDRIYRASVRMGELIDELLSLANVSRAPLTVREVDMSGMAQEIVDDLRINSPGREVIFEAQPGMRAEGDEALLRNALSNLLHNAWKFTRARRPAIIRLSAREEGEFLRFTLADNGIGFDMAHAKRLFQPFQQLHGDQGYGGTGIGLASVRRIIERHGGQIWAEAAPGEGAQFIFALPLRAQVIRRRRK
ncbi:ATP-binding protein [Uliginosibacterium sp. 31-16]|uniref:sensor histidine kinase n=1 Tax=Uliginosibacterium sp. 31-16 TaxID=3068315 RepID=UPI00273DD57D|nr:ATP-binding protein [Uliginosibacterium sp. 31-16]MDP5240272.1 ATP-binding protein [Uliginosibacterium sp. 31-16]